MKKHSLEKHLVARPLSAHFLLLQKRVVELESEVFRLQHQNVEDTKTSDTLPASPEQHIRGSASLASCFDPEATLDDSKVPPDIVALIYQLANYCYSPESLFTPQDVLLEAVSTAQGALGSRETLNVIAESRRPSTYVAQIHATLRARKECREMIKVAQFWKSQALQKEDSVCLVTPSSSALSDILLRDHEACRRQPSKALPSLSPILDVDENFESGNAFSHNQKAHDGAQGKESPYSLLEDGDSLFSGSMSSSPTSVSSTLSKLNHLLPESVAERTSVETSSSSVSLASPEDVTLVCETITTPRPKEEYFHSPEKIGKPSSTQHLLKEDDVLLCNNSPSHNEDASRNKSESKVSPTVVFNTERLHIRKKAEMCPSAAPSRLPRSVLPKSSLNAYPRTMRMPGTSTPAKLQPLKPSVNLKRLSRLPTSLFPTSARPNYAATLMAPAKPLTEEADVAKVSKNQTYSVKSCNPSAKPPFRSAAAEPENWPDVTKSDKTAHRISTMGCGDSAAVNSNSNCASAKTRGTIVAARMAAFEEAQRKS